MTSKTLKQIVKFVTVGVINTGIDIAVLTVLIGVTQKGKQGIYFTLFKAISFVAAAVNSYLMNKYWTFVGARKRNKGIELTQFLVVSIGGLIVNTIAATAFIHYIPPFPNIPTVVSNWAIAAALFGSVAGLAWNYTGYKTFVFKHHHPDLYPPA